jgi:hypothetical protein
MMILAGLAGAVATGLVVASLSSAYRSGQEATLSDANHQRRRDRNRRRRRRRKRNRQRRAMQGR